MSTSDFITIILSVFACIVTVSGWAWWLSSKLTAIVTKLDELVRWRGEVMTGQRELWDRLGCHDKRLDEHGQRIAEHEVRLVHIQHNCDRHHPAG